MFELTQAGTEAELNAVRSLMRSFIEWQHARHADYCDLIDRYFDPVTFGAELENLPGNFAPPNGRLLLATEDGEPVGCVALHALGDGVCEMKRMFVASGFHGRGVGRLLGEAIIAEAKAAGYHTMRLDTGPKQLEAQGLYRRLGFEPIAAYYDLDAEMKDWLVFMECDLSTQNA